LSKTELYTKLIKIKTNKEGFVAKCPLGNWSVYGADLDAVKREAWHYFQQYYEDGDYDK
jgi:hypothetical protein